MYVTSDSNPMVLVSFHFSHLYRYFSIIIRTDNAIVFLFHKTTITMVKWFTYRRLISVGEKYFCTVADTSHKRHKSENGHWLNTPNSNLHARLSTSAGKVDWSDRKLKPIFLMFTRLEIVVFMKLSVLALRHYYAPYLCDERTYKGKMYLKNTV